MKIVQADDLSSIDDYEIREVSRPEPAPGQILVRVATCGIGYVDALLALGRYQAKPPLPYTPGNEIAGTVEAIGEEVLGFAVGDRICAAMGGGGLAEYVAIDAAMAARIPDILSFEQAAGFRVNYLTGLHGLLDRGALAPGERLLVFGAAGGVGSAAVQLGKLLGATVIAAASTEEKRDYARSIGAGETIDTAADGWRDRLRAACGGRGPDVIYDPVCGPLFEPAFRSLQWNGRHLIVGFTGGPIPALPVNLPLMKGSAAIGVDVRQFGLLEPVAAAAHVETLMRWVSEGRLVPPAQPPSAFSDFKEVLTNAMSGSGIGKALIAVGQ